MKIFITIFLSLLVLIGCGSSEREVSLSDQILKEYKLELLRDDIYYFPSKQEEGSIVYQSLKKWDLIFASKNLSDENSADFDYDRLIPGKFTHVLMYMGKDDEGMAYAVEMALDDNSSLRIELQGIKIDGRIYLHALGWDYHILQKDELAQGYDYSKYAYYEAKSLKPNIMSILKENEAQLIESIKEDLSDSFIYQSPIFFNFDIAETKEVFISDDGFTNGSHCAEYITLLFEKVANVCLEDIYISAEEIEDYFIYDPIGSLAKLPAKYNFLSEGELYFYELFSQGFEIKYVQPRESICNLNQDYHGMVTPDRLFNSASLESI